MDFVICKDCNSPITTPVLQCCTQCGVSLITEGEQKNIIDEFVPTCLIHRYEGSDMLEPASIVKEGKRYFHVATKLVEYTRPAKVPKEKVFQLDTALLSRITQLRQERRAYVDQVDVQMGLLWSQLKHLS